MEDDRSHSGDTLHGRATYSKKQASYPSVTISESLGGSRLSGGSDVESV